MWAERFGMGLREGTHSGRGACGKGNFGLGRCEGTKRGTADRDGCALLFEPEDGRTQREETAEEMEVTPPADMYAEGMEEIDGSFLQHVYERHHHIPWIILKTPRCIVKEFSMEYLDALFELYAGKGMTDYMELLYPV